MNRFLVWALLTVQIVSISALTWNEFLHAENIFPVEHEKAESLMSIQSDSDSLNGDHVISELNSLLSKSNFLDKLYDTYLNKVLKPEDVFFYQDEGHKQIFKESLIEIAKHNLDYRNGKSTWFQGVTHVTHLTREEFVEMYFNGGAKRQRPNRFYSTAKIPSLQQAPNTLDWRSNNGQNIVSPVKDQSTCGDCYAFQACAVLESAYAKQNGGPFLDLAEEDIRDCMPGGNPGWGGCNGDTGYDAINYAQQQGGLASESDYPYHMDNETYQCQTQGLQLYGAPAANSYSTNQLNGDENQLVNTLYQYGPVGVDVDATTWPGNYKGGQYNAPCNKVDHAVTLVGYDNENYFIKNSWGTWWGDSGYIYLQRNTGDCCIGNDVTYVSAMA